MVKITKTLYFPKPQLIAAANKCLDLQFALNILSVLLARQLRLNIHKAIKR